jgi:hypothetical protein
MKVIGCVADHNVTVVKISIGAIKVVTEQRKMTVVMIFNACREAVAVPDNIRSVRITVEGDKRRDIVDMQIGPKPP